MRWPWRRRGAIEPRLAADLKVLELQTAKEILAEIFGARPGEVEEMIQRRLEERNWPSSPSRYEAHLLNGSRMTNGSILICGDLTIPIIASPRHMNNLLPTGNCRIQNLQLTANRHMKNTLLTGLKTMESLLRTM